MANWVARLRNERFCIAAVSVGLVAGLVALLAETGMPSGNALLVPIGAIAVIATGIGLAVFIIAFKSFFEVVELIIGVALVLAAVLGMLAMTVVGWTALFGSSFLLGYVSEGDPIGSASIGCAALIAASCAVALYWLLVRRIEGKWSGLTGIVLLAFCVPGIWASWYTASASHRQEPVDAMHTLPAPPK